ncbi:hypothetical protein Oter_3604 [Opitutus terrae PB90-1]|uniref:Uncharacterized protein n=1 Tax=Opitutus terrae (strain DSM 11246 / JCM 15787 / PB90-1) TaxID=452637 RepID=B1ZWC9_OPITP|nr:hypothetical protein Oter_3604 [Opitutus terrae PB90-1]
MSGKRQLSAGSRARLRGSAAVPGRTVPGRGGLPAVASGGGRVPPVNLNHGRDARATTTPPADLRPRLNRAWHLAHRMPPRATLEQRLAWHAAHLRHCACREPSPSLLELMREHGYL